MPRKRKETTPAESKARKNKKRDAGKENAEITYSQRLMRKAAELGITTAELERFIETGERPERKDK